jgi:hypothetical protein
MYFFYNYLLFPLVRKLKFHERYPAFPGSLAMDKEALMMVGNNDAGSFYEMCIEFLDYLEDIINLETGVFESLGIVPILFLILPQYFLVVLLILFATLGVG